MASLDEPAHRRLRNPTVRAFTPRRVNDMAPRIRATVDELLGAVDPSVPFDLVGALCFPLPATMIFSFMGVPREDWDTLKEWRRFVNAGPRARMLRWMFLFASSGS